MSDIKNLKLVNFDEYIPEEFFVFQEYGRNIFDQVNEHNYLLNRRMISSGFKNLLITKNSQEYLDGNIDYLPFIRNENCANIPSTFIFKTINEYNIEHNLEFLRSQNFKKYPSRLSSLFAFGDYESCKQVSIKYNWNLGTVKKFRLSMEDNELSKYIRVGKFNMEIVSLLRGIDVTSFSLDDQNILYEKYWNGESNTCVNVPANFRNNTRDDRYSGVIYEYLIEGILEEIV